MGKDLNNGIKKIKLHYMDFGNALNFNNLFKFSACKAFCSIIFSGLSLSNLVLSSSHNIVFSSFASVAKEGILMLTQNQEF
jgi:hypothetical protein